MPDYIYQTAGFVGVAFYLGSYAALQTGFLAGRGYSYALLNLLASSLVLVSLVLNFNLWSAIIQISWITISIVGVIRIWSQDRGLRFNKEEWHLVQSKLSSLPRHEVRRLLDAGTWVNGRDGEIIARQGEAIGALYYLSEGVAEVHVGETCVAKTQAGAFIGEMTCLSNDPASATVVLKGHCRLFRIANSDLGRHTSRSDTLRSAIERVLGAETREKLLAANRQLELAV